MKCPKHGAEMDEDMADCHPCDGTGDLTHDRCPYCGGHGTVRTFFCDRCDDEALDEMEAE